MKALGIIFLVGALWACLTGNAATWDEVAALRTRVAVLERDNARLVRWDYEASERHGQFLDTFAEYARYLDGRDKYTGQVIEWVADEVDRQGKVLTQHAALVNAARALLPSEPIGSPDGDEGTR